MRDRKRYVHAVSSAILASSLVILSFASLGLGLILNSVNLRLLEVEKLIRKWDVQDASASNKGSDGRSVNQSFRLFGVEGTKFEAATGGSGSNEGCKF